MDCFSRRIWCRISILHNTYLHTTVDLGYIGLALLIITLVWMAIRLIRAIILSPDYSVGFAAALFVYLFTTSFIEVAILYQFSLSSLLFDIVWMYSHVRPRVTLSKPVDFLRSARPCRNEEGPSITTAASRWQTKKQLWPHPPSIRLFLPPRAPPLAGMWSSLHSSGS